MNYQRCPICNIEFKVYKNQKRHYCSVACMKEGYKTQLCGDNNPNYKHGLKHCELCGRQITRNAKSRCLKCRDIGKDNPFLGKKHSDETKQQWSKSRKGKDLGRWKGRKHTEETKTKQSESRRELWAGFSDDEKQFYIGKLLECRQSQLSYKETKPEKAIRLILEDNHVAFERNKKAYDKFLVDFSIGEGKVIIEVFGDYWHGNPLVFSETNDSQQEQIKRDKSRLEYLKQCGHDVIVIWEHEIKNDMNAVVARLSSLWSS